MKLVVFIVLFVGLIGAVDGASCKLGGQETKLITQARKLLFNLTTTNQVLLNIKSLETCSANLTNNCTTCASAMYKQAFANMTSSQTSKLTSKALAFAARTGVNDALQYLDQLTVIIAKELNPTYVKIQSGYKKDQKNKVAVNKMYCKGIKKLNAFFTLAKACSIRTTVISAFGTKAWTAAQSNFADIVPIIKMCS